MSTFNPTTIKIFLTDGTVTGIKTAEIEGSTISAVSCHRTQIRSLLEDSGKYPEAHKTGVYFLFGTDEKTNMNEPQAYIGKAEKISARLKTHLSDKEKNFWNAEVIFFVSKNITTAHAGYLESNLIRIANDTERGYKIRNKNKPNPSSLPVSDVNTMDQFLVNIRLLLGALGHKLLGDVVPNSSKKETKSSATETTQESSEIVATSNNLELFLSAKKIKASAIQTANDGIVVLKGSEAVCVNKSPYTWHEQLRVKLIADKILKLVGDKYIFQKDTSFKTASSAAAIVLGNSENGLIRWKNADGKDLKTIENERMEA
jgi:Domain of unknown function (DUF4357)